jgi:hypothetical protein
LRTFEVLRLGASGLYEHALSETGGVHAIPGCPGLTIDLDAMWRRLDQLEDEEP